MKIKNIIEDVPLNIAAPIIKKCVAKYFNIPVDNFDIKSRKKEIVIPRQIAHFIATFCKDATLEKIGIAIGNQDHATVLHSKREINKFITPINGKINDNEIYRAISFIEHYIIKEIEEQRKKEIYHKNRKKRIKIHIRKIMNYYYKLNKKYV